MSLWLIVLVLAVPVTRSNTPARTSSPPAASKPAPAPSVDRTPPVPAAATDRTSADRTSADRVIYKKRTIIDFTGALIEGDLIKPEGSYVVSRKASRFSSLIRVRENYLPELIASPNDL